LLLCALAGLETGHYEDELDVIARELNISRQAVIKTLLRLSSWLSLFLLATSY
jgi:predicted DNA-binding protein YlxM (UPF0122 family)